MKHTAIVLAGLLAAGLAQAQSHSVANYSNPPGRQADSKAATEATPGLSATADAQDVHHAGKGTRDAQANRSRHRTSSGSAAASRTKSKSPTALVNPDGASKGGAEATMQAEPSERQVDDASRHAFDKTPETK